MRRLLLGLALLSLFVALRGWRSRQAPAPPARSSDHKHPSYDDIALRAYFIGLDHDAHGDQPDPQRDWAEAEHELFV